MTDPYDAPRAELVDTSTRPAMPQATSRPIGVLLVSGFFACTGALAIIGAVMWVAGDQQDTETVSIWDSNFVLAFNVLNLAGAIALYRLHRASLWLFGASLALAVGNLVWDTLSEEGPVLRWGLIEMVLCMAYCITLSLRGMLNGIAPEPLDEVGTADGTRPQSAIWHCPSCGTLERHETEDPRCSKCGGPVDLCPPTEEARGLYPLSQEDRL